MDVLTTRYSENLAGVESCHDRIVITGTLPGACYSDGMTRFLYSRGIHIFDDPRFGLLAAQAHPAPFSALSSTSAAWHALAFAVIIAGP
jgi:hypothetical protein